MFLDFKGWVENNTWLPWEMNHSMNVLGLLSFFIAVLKVYLFQ